tara:strand:- start:5 stop:1240 length:1236 start_codon:yes stop_codon:yes gene_type:complete
MNEDIKNLISQYDNFIYPKPVENIDLEIIQKKKIPYADPNFSWHILWPEKKYNNKSLNILVAGCGSDQASIIAKCNPHNTITGIDISSKSIEYQKKLKEKHKINNLKLICDDFRKIDFKEKFDYIISTGVIHHLDNPGTALDYFYENLKEEGVINLMIYGDKKSQSLNELKKIFKSINLKTDKDSIDIAKNTISNLNINHPAKIFTNSLNDMNHDAGIVDLLLNNQEKFYDFDKLIKLLESKNLIIKNFFDGKVSSLTKFFLYDENVINQIRNLDKNKQLELGQILNWDDRMIELVISKNSQKENSLVYNYIDILNCYFYPNRSVKYQINENNIKINELYSGSIFTYNISKNLQIDWRKIFSGKIKLIDILANKDSNIKKIVENFFNILFENRHIDISFNPIEDYIKYLGK